MGYRIEHAEPADGARLVQHVAASFLEAHGFAVGFVAAEAPLDDGLRIVQDADDGGGQPYLVWTYDPDDDDFADRVRLCRTIFLASQRPELN